ncbi:MAG: fasciclin domain-containing protein [Clostridium sp.]|nr:fasciclin domain-containing protein [Clostridium sp.]
MRILNNILFATAVAAVSLTLSSCSDEFDEGSLYTLTADTVASYIDSNDDFSTFRQLMDETGTRGLLSTYGHYTCFLPTNKAFERYFAETSTSLESMTDQEKETLMYNHIVMNSQTEYTSDKFEEGSLPSVSMSTQKINISYRADDSGFNFDILVNSRAVIIERDIEAHNGVLHTIDNVLYYPNEFIDDILGQQQGFTLFLEAMRKTGVCDLVHTIYDSQYVPEVGIEGFKDPANPEWKPYFVPQEKRTAYTCFAEPDEVFAKAGITTVDQLEAFAQKYYGTSESGNLTAPDNALNRFVRYHILDRQLGANEFFRTNNTIASRVEEVEEFYPTLYDDRLIEVKNRQGGVLNFRNNTSDLSRVPAFVSIDETRRNINAINAYIHAIGDILVYDEDVMRNDVLNRRIRVDIGNLLPELANNYYRWTPCDDNYAGIKIPGDGVYSKYFTCTDATRPYLTFFDDGTYHAVQFYVRGWFDYEIKSLPVPPGEWEMRIGATMHDWYGIAQIFLDGEIQGIPIDLAAGQTANDLRVGWEADDAMGNLNKENDKAMRNRGYMKGPHSELIPGGGGKTLREDSHYLRIIVGRFNSADYAQHTFRSKNIYSDEKYFVIEYIELIPTSQIENEDPY